MQPHGSHSAVTNGNPVPQPSSSSVSIPSGSPPQPSSEQAPESSSCPSDLRGHIHQWAKHSSNSQGVSPATLHHLPQASSSCHFEQGAASNEGHHAVRRSTLHGSRSSRGKADSGSGHGHGIRWNDSRDNLLSSHEDLAQLVPDRASKGGVEQAPEDASSTGQHLCTFLRRPHLYLAHTLHYVLENSRMKTSYKCGMAHWMSCHRATPVALCLDINVAL